MMSENIESIERYLQGVAVPRYISEAHRRQLRRQVLGVVNKRRAALPLREVSCWKIAAAVLVCVAGIVGMFVEARHHLAGPSAGGLYQLISRGRQPAGTAVVTDANDATPTGKGLELIPLLYQQDNLQLVSVIESEVDGRLDSRTYLCKYALPDGRAGSVGPRDPNQAETNPLTSLPAAAWTEISRLRQTGQGENLGTQIQEVKGRPFVFTRERFTLHNGTKVLVSVGAPQEAEPPHPGATGGRNPRSSGK
jgi:hypothetical protein